VRVKQLRRLEAGEVWQGDFGCNLFVVSDDFEILENRKIDSGFSIKAASWLSGARFSARNLFITIELTV